MTKKILRLFTLLFLSASLNAMDLSDFVFKLVCSEQNSESPAQSEKRLIDTLNFHIQKEGFNLNSKHGRNDMLYYAVVYKSSPLVRVLLNMGASTENIYIHNHKVTTFSELVKLFNIDLRPVKNAPQKADAQKLASSKKRAAPSDNEQRKKIKLNNEDNQKFQAWSSLEDEFDFYSDENLLLPNGDLLTQIF